MDIVFDASGNFDEVYLYVCLSSCAWANPWLIDHRNLSQEELMEADLHAIVCLSRNIAA